MLMKKVSNEKKMGRLESLTPYDNLSLFFRNIGYKVAEVDKKNKNLLIAERNAEKFLAARLEPLTEGSINEFLLQMKKWRIEKGIVISNSRNNAVSALAKKSNILIWNDRKLRLLDEVGTAASNISG